MLRMSRRYERYEFLFLLPATPTPQATGLLGAPLMHAAFLLRSYFLYLAATHGHALRLQFTHNSLQLLKQWMAVSLGSSSVTTEPAEPPHLDASLPQLAPPPGGDMLAAAPVPSSDRTGGEAILQALEALISVRSLSDPDGSALEQEVTPVRPAECCSLDAARDAAHSLDLHPRATPRARVTIEHSTPNTPHTPRPPPTSHHPPPSTS